MNIQFYCPICTNKAEIVQATKTMIECYPVIDIVLECPTCPQHLSTVVQVPFVPPYDELVTD